MSEEDRQHWDDRYRALEQRPTQAGLPDYFVDHADAFPAEGRALEIACGTGRAACWLALRGLDVMAYDISPVAIAHATNLASDLGLTGRVRFESADLDEGLPPGPPVDVLLCTMFRATALDDEIIERLKPAGLLAISALSEVGATPGRFRAEPGELPRRFAALEVIASTEADGRAWLIARRPM